MISAESFSVSLSTFALIGLAEIGDKSQLVCIALAARHRHWPIIMGATAAFLILNTLAVMFGAGIAAWVPERVMAGMVALLFGGFGLHALFAQAEEGLDDMVEKPGHSLFIATFLLLFVAEFGDKTQIAVAGLAGSLAPWPVWLGATAALVWVSVLGVWAGRTFLQRLPLHWLHRAGGGIFLVFALIAGWRALTGA